MDLFRTEMASEEEEAYDRGCQNVCLLVLAGGFGRQVATGKLSQKNSVICRPWRLFFQWCPVCSSCFPAAAFLRRIARTRVRKINGEANLCISQGHCITRGDGGQLLQLPPPPIDDAAAAAAIPQLSHAA
jgi:hypothetical protein